MALGAGLADQARRKPAIAATTRTEVADQVKSIGGEYLPVEVPEEEKAP